MNETNDDEMGYNLVQILYVNLLFLC